MPIDPMQFLQMTLPQMPGGQAGVNGGVDPVMAEIERAKQARLAKAQQAMQLLTTGGGMAPATQQTPQIRQQEDPGGATKTALDGFLLTGQGQSPVEAAVKQRMEQAGLTGKKGVAKQMLEGFFGGLAMGPKYTSPRQQIVNEVMKEMETAQQTKQVMTQAQRAEDMAAKYQADLEMRNRQMDALMKDRSRQRYQQAYKLAGDEANRDYLNAWNEQKFNQEFGRKMDVLELEREKQTLRQKAFASGQMKDPGTAAKMETDSDFYDEFGVAPERATPEQRDKYFTTLKTNLAAWAKIMDADKGQHAPKERIAYVRYNEVEDPATGKRGPMTRWYHIQGGNVTPMKDEHIDSLSPEASRQVDESYKAATQARELAYTIDADIKSGKAEQYMGVMQGSAIGMDLQRAGFWGANISADAVETALRSAQLTMGMTRAFTGAQATDNERKYIARQVSQMWQKPEVGRELAWTLAVMNELSAFRTNKRIRPGDKDDANIIDVMPLFYAKFVKDGKLYTAQDMIEYVQKKRGR
jgi:hypothetical protein